MHNLNAKKQKCILIIKHETWNITFALDIIVLDFLAKRLLTVSQKKIIPGASNDWRNTYD